MNAPHTTRRGFIRMLIGTPILHYALTQEIFASTQIRSSYITWRSGCFLPIPSSPSFLGAKENVLFALEHGLKKFGDYKSEITFTCTSPQSMTVFDFLKEKQKEGLLSLGLQNFDGLGSYIHSVNGISEQRLSSL